MTTATPPRDGQVSPSTRKAKVPIWGPWCGAGFLALAWIAREYLGVVGRGLILVGGALSLGGLVFQWRRHDTARRFMLLVVPTLIALALIPVALGSPGNLAAQLEDAGTRTKVYTDPPKDDGGPVNPVGTNVIGPDGSHPQARVSAVYLKIANEPPDKRLPDIAQRLAQAKVEIPIPAAKDNSNDEVLNYLRFFLTRIPNSESDYAGPLKGEAWPSLLVAADPNGDLAARPAIDDQPVTFARIANGSWVNSSQGDDIRLFVGDVQTSLGALEHNAKIQVSLVQINPSLSTWQVQVWH